MEGKFCEWCGEPIYDHGYEIEGAIACEDCLRAYVEDMTPDELAKALGLRVQCNI